MDILTSLKEQKTLFMQMKMYIIIPMNLKRTNNMLNNLWMGG